MYFIFTIYGNSNYGFHLARPRGLFLKAAKNCFILLNGSVALKFVIGQPQRRDSVSTAAFFACLEPLFKTTGAFHKLYIAKGAIEKLWVEERNDFNVVVNNNVLVMPPTRVHPAGKFFNVKHSYII